MSRDLTLIRMEYKMDLIINALQANSLMLPTPMVPELAKIADDSCPVCGGNIRLSIDGEAERVDYTCSCRGPITVVKGISDLAIIDTENTDGSSRTEKNTEVQLEAKSGNRER